MTAFTAPVAGDSKRLDVELIPVGYQLCTFYGLADIGTQDTNFGDKHQVNLAFEFPLQLRQFVEDGEMRPSAIFSDETMSMGQKANLRVKYIEQMIQRKLTDDEAGKFDISQLLGKHYVANIQHSPDGKWANIASLSPLTEQNKGLFGLESATVQQINPTYYFHLSLGFHSENFANLPKRVREKIQASEEGKAHKLAGGTFAEPPKRDSNSQATAPSPSSPSAPQGQKKLQMLVTDFTYEQYISSGWTDETLVSNGKAKWIEPTPAPAPQPSAPSGPSAPSAPAPATPTAPPTPAAPKKVLVFKDPNAQPLETWLEQGWTEEMIVAEGHAVFQ